jgi:hypothetical protein
MAKVYKRRDFIRDISIGSISLGIIPSVSVKRFSAADSKVLISNNFFTIAYDKKADRIDIYRKDGRILFSQVTTRVNLATGRRAVSGQEYDISFEIRNVSEKTGIGRQLIINSRDKKKHADISVTYTLYDKLNCLEINAGCKNVSGEGFIIKSIEPLCAIEEIGSSLRWANAERIITNGPMYYDAGMVLDFDEQFHEPEPYGPIKGGKLSPDFDYPAGKRIHSWWNVGIFSGYNNESLVCGYIENKIGLGQLIISKNSMEDLSLYTESVFAEGTELSPGRSISAGRFLINISQNPYSALEEYAERMGSLNSSRTKSIINGWCSWFYTYGLVSAEEVLLNAEFISGNLKKFGLDYVQIDEGFQRYHGDWEGNERFPQGMKWLADRIKEYGLKPGIWLAPFIISEPTDVFRNHPDWLLKHSDGQLMRVGPWPGEDTDWARTENPRRYCLDISHPEAQKWFFNLFDKIANEWGYEMFKIDFVAWSILSADHYYDRLYTPAMAYRKGMELIRRAIGNEKHINDCGPGPVSVGLIDSMRIEIDQNYGFSEAAWKQYFLDSSSSAQATAKRYYFNKRTWINDADHVCIGLLSTPKAKAAASIIGMSGGNVISGDRLIDLDNTRLEILKKILPACGEAARPVDLFDSDRHAVFAVNITRPFGEWTVIGVFNSGSSETLKKNIPLERFGLNPQKTYIAYDFWMERLFGEVSGSLKINVLPESVTILSLHQKKNTPQVISTDRHLLQGAIEIKDIYWDDSVKTLKGIALGHMNTAYNIMVYTPDAGTWVQGNQTYDKNSDNYSVKQTDNQLLRVHLKFNDVKEINWEITFNEPLK